MKRFFTSVFVLFSLAAASPVVTRVIHVEINQLVFVPAKVSAHVGDTIEWGNKDIVDHSATAKNKEWDIALPAHGKGSVILKTPGHIDYYCKYHPIMKGEIEVSP